jgi:hypothetical protein
MRTQKKKEKIHNHNRHNRTQKKEKEKNTIGKYLTVFLRFQHKSNA